MRAAEGDQGVEVTPHARGPWLVRVGDRRFLVPGAVGREMDCEVGDSGILKNLKRMGEPRSRAMSRPLWVKATLIPEQMTMKLSKILRPWAGAGSLAFMAAAGLAAYGGVGIRLEAPGSLAGWLAGFGLILGTAFWHELGHAAALRHEGYPPGGIGAGILFVIPVLWADVTPVAALPRLGRLRVDLAGICFQLAAGGLCAVVAAFDGPGAAVFGMGAAGALAASVWSLFPFMRTDGYFALGDILGLEDLDRPPPAGSARGLAWFVALYRITHGLFLCGVVVWVPRRIFGLVLHLGDLAGFDPRDPALRAAALLAALGVLGGLAFRLGRRLRRLIFS